MEEEANQLYRRPQMTGPPRPRIVPTEVSAAIKRLKQNKAPGNHNIIADILDDGGEPIVKMFTNMFNSWLASVNKIYVVFN